MKWFNEHLNWTYIIILAIAISILVLMIIGSENPGDATVTAFVGLGIYFLLNITGGGWVLWKKEQSLWYIILAFLFYLAFVFLVLVLKNKRTNQGEGKKISEANYYQNRESGNK